MSNQRHVRKAIIDFEEPNRNTAKDVLTHSVLVVEEAYPEGYHAHKLGIRAAIGGRPEPKPDRFIRDTSPVKAAIQVPPPETDTLLKKFFRRRGL
jgi:hypothetical protein